MSKPKATVKGKSCQTEKGDAGRQDSSDATDSLPPKDDQSPLEIKPVEEKIGEGRDQLRQREKWFQKRSGGRKP